MRLLLNAGLGHSQVKGPDVDGPVVSLQLANRIPVPSFEVRVPGGPFERRESRRWMCWPEDVVHCSDVLGSTGNVIEVLWRIKEAGHLSLPTMAARGNSPSIDAQCWWCGKAPEIVETYGLVIPVSAVRSRIRQEFERHRYVKELAVIDVILFKGQAEYQVPQITFPPQRYTGANIVSGDDEFLEVLSQFLLLLHFLGDYFIMLTWIRQTTHVMQYFRDIEEPRSRTPTDFVGKFLDNKA
jgi:hypothetical protein